jgi:hypothetical protein
MMSDEASCKEGCVASNKPKKIEWVRKVAVDIIAPDADEEFLGSFEIFEVIRPAWRSAEVMACYYPKCDWLTLGLRSQMSYMLCLTSIGTSSHPAIS